MADNTSKMDCSSNSANSTAKVCEFLITRGVEEEIVERFRFEKMDAVAITNASDELLKEMGLAKAGDRLSLKGFCAHQEDESSSLEGNKHRKRALPEAFLSRKKEKNK
ncbi:partial [Paramuricea clavata]|uniref:Partial n=1 Tax=Paramuricea clavata TaxID=317549 RepID=A0A6S7JTL4_PARCT|nr:partial [Paramuricea clavata]